MASGNITAVFFILLSVVTGQACTGFLDYSSGIVKCVEKCASNSQNIGDICCSPSQYFYNGSCRVCSGWVVNAGRDCCHYGSQQLIQGITIQTSLNVVENALFKHICLENCAVLDVNMLICHQPQYVQPMAKVATRI